MSQQLKWAGKMPKSEIIRIIESVKPEGEMTDEVLPRLKAGTSLRIEQAERLDAWLDQHHQRERLKIDADRKAGLARLQQYADERKLAETTENANLVGQYIDRNLDGYWSEANVDATVQVLQKHLHWRWF